IDRRFRHVQREDAQALDRVHEKVHAALPAERADRVQVVAVTAGAFDEAQGDDAGPRIDGGADGVDAHPTAAAGHGAHRDAATAGSGATAAWSRNAQRRVTGNSFRNAVQSIPGPLLELSPLDGWVTIGKTTRHRPAIPKGGPVLLSQQGQTPYDLKFWLFGV